jgi:protoheme IX farnesyltransferase
LLADFAALTKPRIGTMVIFAALTGGLLAAGSEADMGRIGLAAVLIGMVAAAGCVFNQVIERDLDARMHRTAGRPLPSGRVRMRDAILFGTALAVVGTTALAVSYGLLAALLSLGSLVAYSLVYTPLKRYSPVNTVVGAIPGAMPPLLGYVAIDGEPGSWGWLLFATIFVWQFPHFMAIAWMHREDYRRAGMQMLPALPDSDGLAGKQAFLTSLLLPGITLVPFLLGHCGLAFGVVALVFGVGYVALAANFARRESLVRAKLLLYGSLVYLPVLFVAVLLDPLACPALQLG